MANPPFLIIAGKNDQGTEEIAVKIDPSIPLLTAMIRLFRSQGQTRQAEEICRMGLDFFPNQNEIRLLRALCRLDLGETAGALDEIKTFASGFKPLSADPERPGGIPEGSRTGTLFRVGRPHGRSIGQLSGGCRPGTGGPQGGKE